jgi:hypothetical protein
MVKYTFALWTNLAPRSAPNDWMRRHILPDLFARSASKGVARQRLARLAKICEERIPGHQFQHFMTVPSGGDLVSVFVDLHSLDRVAGAMD